MSEIQASLFDLPDLPPDYGEASTLEIARYEVKRLKRGVHISTWKNGTASRWLREHGIKRPGAQGDMRNSLQRMSGHNPDARNSPRTEVDERVVPCQVAGKAIPVPVWHQLGGQGSPQNTGFLVADAADPEYLRRWWE
jgi:hypothetical protein